MKKWLFPALLAALLLVAVGCDQNDEPAPDLPETVDGLTVVTTAEETEAPAEPATEAPTEAATEEETVPETGAPAPETEILSEEEAAALLDEIILHMNDGEKEPVEVTITSEVGITAHMFGFTGTTTIPLSGYYAIDGEKDMMIAYGVPMEGTGVCIVANGMLYLHDGADKAYKASLDDASLDEVRRILTRRLMKQLGSGLPDMSLSPTKSDTPEADRPALPSVDFSLSDLLGRAIASVPLEDAFLSVEACRDTESGEITLILSGISEDVLNAMEGILNILPEDKTSEANVDAKESKPSFDRETSKALVALLREQAGTAVTLTLILNTDCAITEMISATALDLTSIPQLTANMPLELKVVTEITINHEGMDITEPEDKDHYTEAELKDLLMPDEELEEGAKEPDTDGGEIDTDEATDEAITE